MGNTVRTQRRRLAALVAALLAAAFVAGCGTIPGRVGAAALVGRDRVPVDAVQHQLSNALDGQGPRARQALVDRGLLDDVSRGILTVRINHLLVREAARRRNLAVGPQQVSRFVQGLGGLRAASTGTIFPTPQAVRQHAKDLLLEIALGRTVLPELSVTVNYTTERTRRAAMRRARQLADAGPRRARAIIRNQVDRGAAAALDQRIVAAENPQEATAPEFGVPEGTVVAYPAPQQLGAWLVMVVTDRSTQASGRAGNLDDTDPALLQTVGLRQLALAGLTAGIRVNPRYGAWDPIAVRVAPDADQVAGFVAPVGGGRAA